MVKALRKEKVRVKSDERVLADSQEHYSRQHRLQASCVDLDAAAARVEKLRAFPSYCPALTAIDR